MIINTDLRLAIKAAAAAQPHDGTDSRVKAEQAAIAAFFKKYPDKAKRAKVLLKKAEQAAQAETAARNALCSEYGLSKADGYYGVEQKPTGFQFSTCGKNKNSFTKAGGKMPIKGVRWSAEQMISQIAAAEPKNAKQLLKSLGIIWE